MPRRKDKEPNNRLCTRHTQRPTAASWTAIAALYPLTDNSLTFASASSPRDDHHSTSPRCRLPRLLWPQRGSVHLAHFYHGSCHHPRSPRRMSFSSSSSTNSYSSPILVLARGRSSRDDPQASLLLEISSVSLMPVALFWRGSRYAGGRCQLEHSHKMTLPTYDLQKIVTAKAKRNKEKNTTAAAVGFKYKCRFENCTVRSKTLFKNIVFCDGCVKTKKRHLKYAWEKYFVWVNKRLPKSLPELEDAYGKERAAVIFEFESGES